MSKKLLKFCCISMIVILAACAPKLRPPALYRGADLSLDEVVAKAGAGIEVMKAVADIKIEKNNKPYDSVSASVLVKKPGWVHMRIYKFGMLVRDFVIRDRELYTLSGKESGGLKKIGREFYRSIFWWDDLGEGVMYSRNDRYIIRAEDRTIHLDRGTLLPLRQEFSAFGRQIDIKYSNPDKEEDGRWHQSFILIHAGEFAFKIRLKKLTRNPSLGEYDFRVPVES